MNDKTPNNAEDSVDPSLDPDAVVLDPDAAELDPAGELLADEHLVDPGSYEVAADELEAEELDPETADDDPEQTVLAEAASIVAASTKPVKRQVSQAPVKKAAATPKRSGASRDDHDEDKRVGPVTFAKQSVGELKKVNWPTGEQLRQYFFAVLIFVLFIIAYVGLLDLGLGAALLKLFG